VSSSLAYSGWGQGDGTGTVWTMEVDVKSAKSARWWTRRRGRIVRAWLVAFQAGAGAGAGAAVDFLV